MRTNGVVAAAVLLAVSCGLVADEWRDLYDLRFGAQRKKVDVTATKTDDAALAAEHLADARKYFSQPEFVRILLEEAYALGLRGPKGHETAVAAIGQLLDRFPDGSESYQPQAVKICELRYRYAPKESKAGVGRDLIGALLALADRKADAREYLVAASLTGKALTVARSVRVGSKELLEAWRRYYVNCDKLQRNPKDTSRRASLVRHCVAEMGEPAEAVTLLADGLDETLRNHVALAAKDSEQLPEDACMDLGQWYASLSKGASPTGRAICYHRASTYLRRYLAVHLAVDASRLKAKLLLDQAKVALSKLPAAPSPIRDGRGRSSEQSAGEIVGKDGEWVNVLEFVEPSRHAVRGIWKRLGEALQGSVPQRVEGLVRIPVKPAGSYELDLTFVRQKGKGRLGVRLLVGENQGLVLLSGLTDKLQGVGIIRGKLGETDGGGSPAELVNGQTYTAKIRVELSGDDAVVDVALNGEEHIHWSGPQGVLGLQTPEDSLALVLGTASSCAFKGVRLRMLSGEATRMEYDAPTSAASGQKSGKRRGKRDKPRKPRAKTGQSKPGSSKSKPGAKPPVNKPSGPPTYP